MTDSSATRSATNEAAAAKPLLKHPFRRKNFRLRVLVPVAAAVAVIVVAEPTRTTVMLGLPLILAGSALRIWATGLLVKTDELCVSGPYAHLRHPLYAGTLAIGTGFVLLAGIKVAAMALPLFLGAYFGYYYPYKERVESARLEEHYGARYVEYRAAVHGLLPSLRPWKSAAGSAPPPWQFTRFRDNAELGTCVAIALALVAFSLHAL